MKSNFWLLGGLAWLAAASVPAQDAARNTNPPVVSRLLTGPLARDVVLDPPALATVKIESLLVRTQPAFAGDVLTHVVKGQTLTVLEEISLAKPKLNEPTNWARITLPTNAAVWVFADYINTNAMTVSARHINVRGGPGDYFGVVALLEKGAPVKQVRRTADWIQIEPPTNACGFVASDYLTMHPPHAPPPALIAATEPAAAAPATAAPAPPEPVAPEATPPAATPPPAATVAPEPVAPVAASTTNETEATHEATNAASAAAAPPPIVAPEPVATPPAESAPAVTPAAAAPAAAPPAAAAPAAAAPIATPAAPAAASPESASIDTKPRVVAREGVVRRALNLQAPTDYELRDVSSGSVIEYLQVDAQDKTFKKYIGARILVSGTEWLDRRWPKTPILRIQNLDLMP